MIRLHLKKQICMEGGYMFKYIVIFIIGMVVIQCLYAVGYLIKTYINCKLKEWEILK